MLKRASASRPSGERNDDEYDVFADYAVVGSTLLNGHSPRVNN
jgi:hypothetical protein